MIIAVVDSHPERPKRLAARLTPMSHEVMWFDGQSWRPRKPQYVDLLLFHTGNSGDWPVISTIEGIDQHVVWYSGGGVQDRWKGTPNGLAIPEKVQTGDEFSESAWASLLAWLDKKRGTDAPLPQILKRRDSSWPRELVAIYLALAASRRGIEITNILTDEDVWNRANEQVASLIRQYRGTHAPVWQFAPGGLPSNRQHFSELRRLLEDVARKQAAPTC